jgi:hypothetical protein
MFQRISLLAFCLYTATLLHAQHPSLRTGHRQPLEKPKFEQARKHSALLSPGAVSTADPRMGQLRSGATEKLDSVIVTDRERITFEYDTHGHLSRLRYALKFFAQGDWEPFFQIEYLFTPEGYLLEETYAEWSDDLLDWKPSQREVNSYLPAGSISSKVIMVWDEVSLDWQMLSRTLYTYLPNQRLDQEEYQDWAGPGPIWTTYARAVYQYDASYRLEEILRNWYEPLGNDWLPWQRETYHYGPADLVAELSQFVWETLDQNWRINSQYQYVYNANGERIMETNSYYDVWTMALIPSYRETFEYDVAGNMVSTTFNYWDELQGGFSPEDRRDFEYDLNTPLSAIQFPHIWDEDFILNNKLLRLRIFSYANGSWQENFFADFHYSPVVTSLASESKQAIRVYPNPASDYLVMALPAGSTGGQLTILHAAGQPVLQERINAEQTTLSLRHIPAGIYVLQYRAEGEAMMSLPVVIHR